MSHWSPHTLKCSKTRTSQRKQHLIRARSARKFSPKLAVFIEPTETPMKDIMESVPICTTTPAITLSDTSTTTTSTITSTSTTTTTLVPMDEIITEILPIYTITPTTTV